MTKEERYRLLLRIFKARKNRKENCLVKHPYHQNEVFHGIHTDKDPIEIKYLNMDLTVEFTSTHRSEESNVSEYSAE